ncbi:zinc finger protein 836-like [Ctenocephalides felis]|uniref:zinc finger protein 836-like n=1 Tax=Ctenocephalides felis TaxID=7515 RepID=UPI000E6E1218|nr:zinc finger protein 836-like [Ctenocephalides felis]
MSNSPTSSLNNIDGTSNYGADICRVCLTANQNLIPIFLEEENYFSAESSIYNMFTSCTGQIISLDDQYPKHICFLCLEQLYSSYDFWKKCQNALEKLREIEEQNTFYFEEERDGILEQFEIYKEDIYSETTVNIPDNIKESHCEDSVIVKEEESINQFQNKCEDSVIVKEEESINQFPNKYCNNNSSSQTYLLIFKPQNETNSSSNEKENQKPKPKQNENYEANYKSSYRCKKCELDFSNKDKYSEHVKQHNCILCHICGYLSRNISSFQFHVLGHSNIRPFKCNACEKSYKTKTMLNKHKLSHQNEKKYKCKYCGENFTNTNRRYYHIKMIHDNNYPHACEICPKTFKLKNHLINHRMIHTGERRYPCTMCPSAFTTSSGLRNHTYTHTGEKKFSCTLCDRRFTRLHTLKNHMVFHTRERRYKCDKCGKTYTQRHGLRRHMKKKHELGK